MNKTILTPAALEKLKGEYDALIEKRHQISDEIKVARGFGDLSENAEYHAAREAQSHNETEILKLKQIIENHELVDTDQVEVGMISINSVVTVKFIDFDEEEDFTIVTKIESDPLDNKISNESPIGQALMGKVVGDKVSVESPAGVQNLEIIAVQ